MLTKFPVRRGRRVSARASALLCHRKRNTKTKLKIGKDKFNKLSPLQNLIENALKEFKIYLSITQ
jgi:hypothetical protein